MHSASVLHPVSTCCSLVIKEVSGILSLNSLDTLPGPCNKAYSFSSQPSVSTGALPCSHKPTQIWFANSCSLSSVYPNTPTQKIPKLQFVGGRELKWQKNRMGRPLSPPQIHRKNIWTLSKLHKTSLCRQRRLQNSSPLSSKGGRTKYKR